MTNHHHVTLDIEASRIVEPTATMTCTAPEQSLCRAVWDCGCEEWGDPRIEDGRPVHTIIEYGDDEDIEVDHVGRFDPAFCNLREWFHGSDETLNGKIVVAVTPEWTGDGYMFTITGSDQ